MQRYFGKKENNNMILNNDDLYHIKKVMRMKNNDEIIVVSDEVSYLCEIVDIMNNIIKIKKELNKQIDNMPNVRLIIPLLKEQKMDLIIQKATELGVYEIVLYFASRSVIKVNEKIDKKLIRWSKIAKEASEQSHRDTIPSIIGVKKIDELDFDGLNILCSTRESKKNVKNILNSSYNCDTINIAIGPEGGLNEKEEEQFNKDGYNSTSLGNRIMRVETVPMFILSVINYEYME